MASGVYLDTLPGSRDLDTIVANGLKVALFGSSLVVPSFTATGVLYGGGGFAANQIVGSGYVAGGQAVTTLVRTFVDSRIALTADDPAWPTATISGVRYALYYDVSDNAAVYLDDFGANYGVVAATFPITLAGGVILRLAA